MSALHKAEALIWDIPGGIHPVERKELSNRTPIQQAPLPERLTLPLNQHIGAPAEPVVAVGERVLKGQLIAAANGFVSVPVHAPTSGTVSFIGPQPYPHVSGMLAPAIVIDSDGLDEWIELSPQPDYRHLESSALVELIRQAGITKTRNAGKAGEYLNVKPEGAAKGVNLKEYVFSREFIEMPTAEKRQKLAGEIRAGYEDAKAPRPTPADIAERLKEGREGRAAELKYMNSGNRKAYAAYREADPEQRRAILAERAAAFYGKHRPAVELPHDPEQERPAPARAPEQAPASEPTPAPP